MSLINKMLRELDKRHAQPETSSAPPPLAQTLRPVKDARVGSDLFWWAIAGIMVVAIVWLAWVMWQLSPRSVVNEVALRPFSAAPAGRVGPGSPQEITLQSAGNQQADDPQMSSPAGSSALFPVARGGVDMLRLATEITTPIPARPKPGAASPPGKASAASAPSPASAPVPAGPQAAHSPPVERLLPTPLNRAAPAVASQDASRIDKREPAAPRNRTETEYRRAVALVNQGRVSEGMEALRSSLAADAAHEPARQTLVALLVEQRRFEEAVAVLQEGLNLSPANSDFAMLLARILVDRQDVSGALAVLQKYSPAAGTKADYHGFAAALYQRMGQHREAIDEYQTALRLSPQSAVWWVGLGISQEASDRRKEALESFRRARASGSLNSDLLAYVDQRLRQLQ